MIATALLKGGFLFVIRVILYIKPKNYWKSIKMIGCFNILSIISMWYYMFLTCKVSWCINLKC